MKRSIPTDENTCAARVAALWGLGTYTAIARAFNRQPWSPRQTKLLTVGRVAGYANELSLPRLPRGDAEWDDTPT